MEKPYSPGFQIFILFLLMLGTIILSQFVFLFGLTAWYPGLDLSNVTEVFKNPWVQISGAFFLQVFTHFLTFLLFLRVTGLKASGLIDFSQLKAKWVLLLPVGLVVSFLAMEGGSVLSEWIFEATGGYEFLEAEMRDQQQLKTMLLHDDPFRFIMSLCAMAVLPAIGEELIYRGVLFSRLMAATNNVHFSALISGIIFACLHLKPVQLLPIAIMGMLFAYVYYYTKNIWYTILLHFFINAIQITLFYAWPELVGLV